MALELDTRQRAMLKEMGVQVWLPEQGVMTFQAPLSAQPAAASVQSQSSTRVGPAAQASARVSAPKPTPSPAAARAASTHPTTYGQQPAPLAQDMVAAPLSGRVAALDWPELAEAVRGCNACGLCAGRKHASIAPLADAIPCDWMVVSDPPDEEEDYAGAPFAAQDGVLLSNMLRALGLQRANPLPGDTKAAASTKASQRAYVSHVLKCRPAHGAIPQAAELAQCAAYLQREIALVQPKMIVAMGRFANQVLLGETPEQAALPLGKLRGTVHRYRGVPVVVTYHPKALMRNGADKAKAWADLCLAADTLTTTLSP